MHDAKSDRQLYQLPLGMGAVYEGLVFARKSLSVFFLIINSYLSPAVTYHGDFSKCANNEGHHHVVLLKEYRRSKITGVNVEDFVTKQVTYKSKDGTTVKL